MPDAPAPRPAGDYRWQTYEPGAAPAKRRRMRLILLAGLCLALISVATVWILLLKPLPPDPFCLTISIGEYNGRQYPVVAFARQDSERLQRHFILKKKAETKTRELLRKELAGLAVKTEPLIVHITALALVRDEKIYLLPGDADPENPSTWLEVREVVDAMTRSAAKEKLLILDLGRPLADARLGVLTDRVAEALENYLAKKEPAFYVLCPCSAGQYSLTSENLQGSALAYYLDQGLQGHADANKDLRITVQELFGFVKARVERWSQNNRGQRQTPLLLGKGKDFVLATLSKPPDAPAAEPALEPYPPRLQEAWKTRDHWWTPRALHQAPRLLAKLEAHLARQDKLWRGGALPKKDQESADAELQVLAKELAHATLPRNVPARSLALALPQIDAKINQPLVDSLRDTLTKIDVILRTKEGAEKELLPKIREEFTARLGDPKKVEFPPQAWATVDALILMPNLGAEQVVLTRDVLALLQARQRFVEVLYVQRLAEFAERLESKDPDTWKWPGEKVQQLLQTVHAHEAVIAALNQEPAFLPWIASVVADGDQMRRAGEKKLLWERPGMWKEASAHLQAAKEKYDRALQALQALSRCRQSLDRACAELPAYMLLLTDGPDADALGEQTWGSAAETAAKLQAFFLAPPDLNAPAGKGNVSFAEADNQDLDLQRYLQDLEKMLQRRGELVEKDDRPEAVRQFLWLLENPLLKAGPRGALFRKERELALKFHTRTLKQDQDDNQAGHTAALPEAGPKKQDLKRGLTRARMSLALLRLGGFDAGDRKFVVPAAEGKIDVAEVAALEAALHDAWAVELVKQWHHPKTLYLGDALNRIVPAWELEKAGADSSRLLQKNEREAFVHWLQEYYQAEARFLEGGPHDQQASLFFTEAARELRLKSVDGD